MARIDKQQLFLQLSQRLHAKQQAAVDAQQAAQAGAFHEDNKSEGSKDMRQTEASYLARGLAQRVAELQAEVQRLANFKLRDFGANAPIALGTLVQVEDGDGLQAFYFVSPVEGGLSLVQAGQTVQLISPKSPLGRALLGKTVDDEVDFTSPQGARVLTVLAVS